MKRIITINIVRVLLLFLMAKPAQAVIMPMAEQSAEFILSEEKMSYVYDKRKDILKRFLTDMNSPLVNYADIFVDKADEYSLFDWRLVPAITGVESTFGKAIPEDSYNAYGWGNGSISFTSWEHSIDVVTQALKVKYIDRGLNSVEKIAPVYAPPSTTWAYKVNMFMEQISNFAPHRVDHLDLTI